uniref:PRELI/MSF1 domain-containing protein n=1 Tax=Ascaris lumbricoides TaxID=6252 RepID=A0A9J2QAK5_ASCLU
MSRLGLKWLENRLKPKDWAKDTDWVPIARIGLEYNKKESLLSVYIKCFLNLPPVVGPRHMECLARVIVVKRVRRSWIQSRHATVVNIEEVNPEGRIDMETLSVRRQKTTVFNQWYCCELPKQLFHTCALKIQFCHLNRLISFIFTLHLRELEEYKVKAL